VAATIEHHLHCRNAAAVKAALVKKLDAKGWKAHLQGIDPDARGLTFAQAGDPMTLANGTQATAKTHAHHIVYKRGLGETQQRIAREARDVLIYHNIDPYYGKENLAWAPNWGHGPTYIDRLKNELISEYEGVNLKSNVITILKNAATRFVNNQMT